MPSSPRTPRHSRRPSNLDLSFSTPDNNGFIHSKASMNSPTFSNNRHNVERSDSIGNDMFGSNGGAAPSNGLGNLADELADAWDDEEGEEEEEQSTYISEVALEGDEPRDDGVEENLSREPKSTSPILPISENAHRRHQSDYDGSGYGDGSDSPGISPGLALRMDMVESLARASAENAETDEDSVVQRVMDELKDLRGQSGVEGGASRLITAHSALSTHLLHQTRLLQSLAYPLLSPFSLPPNDEFIDDLLPLLLTLNVSIPRPITVALTSLTHLHILTTDLVQTINYLSDSLYMSRQTTTIATRRLRSARELVAEMRREEEEREEGERWLTRGNWSQRLAARECAAVCGDVVGGFEEVCNGWRARLIAQGESISA